VDDPEITALVKRLSRPHPSGGIVIERAAILAAGPDFTEVMDWIIAHSGTPDTAESPARSRGLHGAQIYAGGDHASRTPLRFVLPPGTLS
jgi:hypothetical protein